jgi:quinol monooxygenase YgiN
MELTIFASFRAREGEQEVLASEFRVTAARVLSERGCLGIEFYRSVRDSRLFWLHARWIDEEAFEKHAELRDTTQFIDRVQRLIDHPFEVSRTCLLS